MYKQLSFKCAARCSPFVLVDFFLILQLSILSRKLIQGPLIVFGSQFACLGVRISCSSALMVDVLEKFYTSKNFSSTVVDFRIVALLVAGINDKACANDYCNKSHNISEDKPRSGTLIVDINPCRERRSTASANAAEANVARGHVD